ncbi:MAG TPA: aspartyl protease family protein [Terriglobia bacterium]|nr:aspartyl protease family protein [Terriglobia bacterium]
MASLFARLQAELSAGRLDEAEGILAALEESGADRDAALGRLVLAIRRHDGVALQRLASSGKADLLRRDPKLHLLLARAFQHTLGLAAAAPELESLCANRAISSRNRIRQEACALAHLARLGQSPQKLEIPPVAEAPFEIKQGLAIIQASLNHLKPQYFILDTGAPGSILNRSYCERAGISCLEKPARIARDAGGNPLALTPICIERLQLGSLTIRNWRVEAATLSANLKVAGILSPLDAFRGYGFELDFKNRALRVYSTATPLAEVTESGTPFQVIDLVWDGGKCFVRGSVNRRARGWFLLDSGSAGSLITPEVARTVQKNFSLEQSLRSPVAAGRMEVFQGFTGTLAIEGDDEMQTDFAIVRMRQDPDAIMPLKQHGVIGIPWMEERRLFFPSDRRRVYITKS